MTKKYLNARLENGSYIMRHNDLKVTMMLATFDGDSFKMLVTFWLSKIGNQHLKWVTNIINLPPTSVTNITVALNWPEMTRWPYYMNVRHTFWVNLNCSWQFWSIFTSTGRSIWYVPSDTCTINWVVGSKSRSKSIWSRFSSRCDSISPVIGFISSSSFSLISFDDLTLYRKFVSKSRDVSMGVTFWALSQGLIQSYNSWWVESQRAKRAKFTVPCVRRPYICLHNMAERWNTSPIVVFGGAMCTVVVAAAIWYGGGQAVFIINWIMGLGFKIVVSTLENFFFQILCDFAVVLILYLTRKNKLVIYPKYHSQIIKFFLLTPFD